MKTKWIILVFLALFVRLSQATEPAPVTQQSNQQRWNALSEEEKNHIRENYTRWKTLPEDRKTQLRENHGRFKSLTPAEQNRIRENSRRFKGLSTERQEIIRKRFEKFRKLPPGERKHRFELLREKRLERKWNKKDKAGKEPLQKRKLFRKRRNK